jgi:cGMP-dependent protein kinase
MYIIKDGQVNCSQKGTIIRTLHKGDFFGERALLLDSVRGMDVIAKTRCVVYSISVETLKTMVGDQYRNILYLNFIKMAFSKSQNFQNLNLRLLDNIFSCFKAINLDKNDIAFNTGHIMSSKLVIILEGNLVNATNGEVYAKRGDILFELDVINKTQNKLEYDLVAQPDCLYVEAVMSNIVNTQGGDFSDMLNKFSVVDALHKVNMFKNLSANKLDVLSRKILTEKYDNGKSIIKEGEEGDKFYIVGKGKVDIFVKGNYIRTLNENEYFGERALFFKEARSATAIANGPVEVYYLTKDDFRSIIDNNMKEFLINRLYLQDNTIQLSDLEYVQQLGSGSYGSVYLVQATKNKYFYAIKSISKNQIDAEELHKNIDLERSILLKIDHPFIVKLVKTLKDKENIFFLMEYIKGKELFDIIREIGLLNKYQTQFYGASLMLAVDYLHMRKCVYRDIKPENVLVLNNVYSILLLGLY